jgi:hypothetical protein
VAYRGGVGVFNPLPLQSRSFDKAAFDYKLSGKYLVFLFQHPNLKIAEFRKPTPQDIQEKGSKIRNCFTLAMTNELVVVINRLKYQKLIKFYHMK